MKKVVSITILAFIASVVSTTAIAQQSRIESLESQCNSGDLDACDALGCEFARGDLIEADLPKAANIFTSACDKNNGSAWGICIP